MGEREDRLIAHNLIGGGWDLLPTLQGVQTKDDLAALYASAYPDASKPTAANYVGQLWSLLDRMSDDDLVVMPLKTTGTIAVGQITGPYEYRSDLGPDLTHVRPVAWTTTDVPRDAFDQDLLYSFGAFLTFGQVRRDHADERVLAAVAGKKTVPRFSHSGDSDTPVAELEQEPDVDALATEQVRQYVSQRFAGHELAALVAAILQGQGYVVATSAPGADRGVDILAGSGPLGLNRPHLAVQVKTGQAGVDEFRALKGVMEGFRAEQGLLVAWAGFKGTVRDEARHSHFTVRLWDASEMLAELFTVYERLPDEIRSKLPLKRVWALVPDLQ